ncbi:MAG TPA: lipid II flippase MurJ [Candidatus Brocadiia bacterium]|nr:lipid II flippase MurJ [Candidatus Brocadiia bacterium]
MTDAHAHAHLGSRIAKGMFVLIFFGLFHKFGGFLMSLIVSRYYGLGDITAAYMQVYSIILYLVVYSTALKVVMPAFMPIFAEERERQGEQTAWRLASTVGNLSLGLGVALSAACWAFAGPIVDTLVPGFSGARRDLAVQMLRGMAPGALVLVFAVMATAIFNSYKVFSFPSAAEAAHKLVWALGLFGLIYALRDSTSAVPIIAAFLCACAAQAVVLAAGLWPRRSLYTFRLPSITWRRLGIELGLAALFLALFGGWVAAARFAPAWAPRGFTIITGGLLIGWAYAGVLWARTRNAATAAARFAALAAPLIVGVLFARYRDIMGAYFQSFTEGGDFASIELAKKVVNLPTILVAYSLSIAMFPYLCDLAARKDSDGFGRLYHRSIRMIALGFVPLTAFLIVCGAPLMQLIFDPGSWSAQDTWKAGAAIAIHASGLFFYAIENVLMQTYFSLQRVVAPTALGILVAVVHVAFMYVFIQLLGYSDPAEVFWIVLISFPATRALKNLILMLMIRVRSAAVERAAAFWLKLAVVTAAVALAAWAGQWAGDRLFKPRAHLPRLAAPAAATPQATAEAPAPRGASLQATDAAPARRPASFASRVRFELAKLGRVALPGGLSAIVFLAACWLLRIEEVHIIIQWIRARGWRNRPKAPPAPAGESAT